MNLESDPANRDDASKSEPPNFPEAWESTGDAAPAGPDLESAVKIEAPVAKAEPPVAKTELPVAKAEPPVANAELPVAKTEPPVAKAEPPVANAELPVAKTELPVAKTELPETKRLRSRQSRSRSCRTRTQSCRPKKTPSAVPKILSPVANNDLTTDNEYSSQTEARATLAAISKAMEERSKQPLQRSDKLGEANSDSSPSSAILTVVSRPNRREDAPKQNNEPPMKPTSDSQSAPGGSIPLRIVPAISARDTKRSD